MPRFLARGQKLTINSGPSADVVSNTASMISALVSVACVPDRLGACPGGCVGLEVRERANAVEGLAIQSSDDPEGDRSRTRNESEQAMTRACGRCPALARVS